MSDPNSNEPPTLADLRAAAEEEARLIKARRNAPLRRGVKTLWLAPRTLVRLRNWLAVPSWLRIGLAACVLAASYAVFAFAFYNLFNVSDGTLEPYLILVGCVVYLPSFVVLTMFSKMLHDGVGYHAKQLVERRARDWSHGNMTARSSLALCIVLVSLFFAPFVLDQLTALIPSDMVVGFNIAVSLTTVVPYFDTRNKIFQTAEKRRRYCLRPDIHASANHDTQVDQMSKPHLSVWDKSL